MLTLAAPGGESKIMAGFMLPSKDYLSLKALDHLGLLDQPLHPPRLGLRELATSLDLDQVAFLVFVVLVVHVVLFRPPPDLAEKRMLDAALDQDRHRLVHLVADDAADLRLYQTALDVRRRFDLFVHACPAFRFSKVLTRAMSRRTRTTLELLVSCCVAFCMRSPNCSFSSAPSSARSSSGDFSRRSLLRSEAFIAFSTQPRNRGTKVVR